MIFHFFFWQILYLFLYQRTKKFFFFYQNPNLAYDRSTSNLYMVLKVKYNLKVTELVRPVGQQMVKAFFFEARE